jgi:hypothetical protein
MGLTHGWLPFDLSGKGFISHAHIRFIQASFEAIHSHTSPLGWKRWRALRPIRRSNVAEIWFTQGRLHQGDQFQKICVKKTTHDVWVLKEAEGAGVLPSNSGQTTRG